MHGSAGQIKAILGGFESTNEKAPGRVTQALSHKLAIK
jgi:hypothetical protein